MAQPKRFDINKVENFLKNSADKAQIVSHWNAAYEHGETIRTIDENLARNDDNKQIAELLLRRIDVINRRERLFKAIQNAIKIKYQPQITEMFSTVIQVIKSRFVELQQQNSSIGKLIILMSALQDENQILNYLDLEEKKRAIDERIAHNEKLRDERIENGEDAEEDYAAACQELLQEKSDLKLKIEALLKSGEGGAILRSLEDAEQRLADVRASVAADKSSRNDTSTQKEPEPDEEQKEDNGYNADDRQEPRNGASSLPIDELSIHLRSKRTKSNKTSVISKTSSARRFLDLELKSLKEQEELQTRLEKLRREANEVKIASLQDEMVSLQEEMARKAKIAEKEREIAEVSSSQGTSFPSVSSVDSFTEDSRCMDETETIEDGAKSNIALSVHLKSENAVKLVHEGKFSALRRDSKSPTEADEQADDGTCRKEAISQPDVKLANQGTSQLITTECIQKLSETFIVDNGRQDVRSETLLVDTKQVLEEDIHLGMSEHSISQTKENLNHTMAETRKEHRFLSFASSKQSSEELNVKLELLQESAENTAVQQDIQQGKIFEVTMFHDSTLLLEEGNKCFEFDESYGFVHEQQFALLDDCNEEAMYRKLCHVAAKHDEPVECNAKGETRTMIATFGKKFDFDFKVSLVEETIPSNNNEWNPRIGNGNSGMDAVAQANGMDKTQLSKSHRKRPKKQAWKFEHTSNLLHGMVECVQLTTGILYAKIVIDEFADERSLMETQLGSSKAQTTTSSENGPFIGPAVSWEEMMMQLEFFGKWKNEEVRQLEVNDLVWIVDANVKRAHYKMGRGLEVYHGSDGRVRSALVKTEDGKLKRPVVKLAPMFYESVFREKNRAGNVGASQLRDQKLKFERD